MKAAFYGIKKSNKFHGRINWFSDNVDGTEGEEGTPSNDGTAGGEGTPPKVVNPLDVPGVKELLEKTRKEEKDKLYKSLNEANEKLKQLETEKKTKEEEIAIAQKAKEITEATMSTEVAKLTMALNKVQEDQRKGQLELYKERALKAAGDELVEAMVGGNTEEEIDESINKAKEQYMAILERAKKQVKTPENFSNTTNPTQPKTPKQLGGQDIRTMSEAEFAKNRDLLKTQLGL